MVKLRLICMVESYFVSIAQEPEQKPFLLLANADRVGILSNILFG